MNNDFHIQRSDAPKEPAEEQAPQPQPVVAPRKRPGKFRKFTSSLLLFVLVIAAAAGVYLWQQKNIDNLTKEQTEQNITLSTLQTKLDEQTAAAKAAAEAAATTTTGAPAAASFSIVTGPVTANAVGTANIELLYLPTKVTEVWLEYGTEPTALTKSTAHAKDGVGTGDAAVYKSQGFSLGELQPTKNYFYRAAAKAAGKTIYGGVASFKASNT